MPSAASPANPGCKGTEEERGKGKEEKKKKKKTNGEEPTTAAAWRGSRADSRMDSSEDSTTAEAAGELRSGEAGGWIRHESNRACSRFGRSRLLCCRRRAPHVPTPTPASHCLTVSLSRCLILRLPVPPPVGSIPVMGPCRVTLLRTVGAHGACIASGCSAAEIAHVT